MLDRRAAIRLAIWALSAAWLLPSAARAQQSFQRFLPLFVDLPGWKGGKPDGMAMEVSGNSMVSAQREYERGASRIHAQIIVGPVAEGALKAAGTGIKIETSEMHMSTSTIDGLQVTRTFTLADKSGAIIVGLATNAMFNLAFNGVEEDEALTLAKAFNWKAMQQAVPAK